MPKIKYNKNKIFVRNKNYYYFRSSVSVDKARKIIVKEKNKINATPFEYQVIKEFDLFGKIIYKIFRRNV